MSTWVISYLKPEWWKLETLLKIDFFQQDIFGIELMVFGFHLDREMEHTSSEEEKMNAILTIRINYINFEREAGVE